MSRLLRRKPPVWSLRFALPLAVGLIVAGASGCGGNGSGQRTNGSTRPVSKAQYEHKVQQIQQDVFAKVNPATILLGARGGDASEGLRAVQKASVKEAEELGGIAAPPEIARAHRSLVTALRRYGDELSRIIAALGQRKLSAQDVRVKLRWLPSVEAIRAARVAIARKGYNIGPP